MKYHYITNFEKSRETRIGASDIPALLPHPERPHESLAGYKRTAMTVYEEKLGLIPQIKSNLAMRQGHREEPGLIWEFINEFYDVEIANNFYNNYLLCEIAKRKDKNVDYSKHNEAFNPFRHHTEVFTEWGIAHGDCLYDNSNIFESKKIKLNNITVDFSKNFGFEGKSARSYVAKGNQGEFDRYDFDKSSWEGIPLRPYVQIQFQMVLYEWDYAILGLLYDTSNIHYWHVKPNKKLQTDLVTLAMDLKKCIDKKQPPKLMLRNYYDIRKIYPEIKKNDFKMLSGDELIASVDLVKKYQKAKKQKKNWEGIEKECKHAISIFLKDQKELQGTIDGELKMLARWKGGGGYEEIEKLSEINKNNPEVYRYLKRKKLINTVEKYYYPEIVWKE